MAANVVEAPVQAPVVEAEREVCRDYLKGVCFRGNCRFAHTTLDGAVAFKQPVCRDFENGRCFRASCRFYHRTSLDDVTQGANAAKSASNVMGAAGLKAARPDLVMAGAAVQLPTVGLMGAVPQQQLHLQQRQQLQLQNLQMGQMAQMGQMGHEAAGGAAVHMGPGGLRAMMAPQQLHHMRGLSPQPQLPAGMPQHPQIPDLLHLQAGPAQLANMQMATPIRSMGNAMAPHPLPGNSQPGNSHPSQAVLSSKAQMLYPQMSQMHPSQQGRPQPPLGSQPHQLHPDDLAHSSPYASPPKSPIQSPQLNTLPYQDPNYPSSARMNLPAPNSAAYQQQMLQPPTPQALEHPSAGLMAMASPMQQGPLGSAPFPTFAQQPAFQQPMQSVSMSMPSWQPSAAPGAIDTQSPTLSPIAAGAGAVMSPQGALSEGMGSPMQQGLSPGVSPARVMSPGSQPRGSGSRSGASRNLFGPAPGPGGMSEGHNEMPQLHVAPLIIPPEQQSSPQKPAAFAPMTPDQDPSSFSQQQQAVAMSSPGSGASSPMSLLPPPPDAALYPSGARPARDLHFGQHAPAPAASASVALPAHQPFAMDPSAPPMDPYSQGGMMGQVSMGAGQWMGATPGSAGSSLDEQRPVPLSLEETDATEGAPELPMGSRLWAMGGRQPQQQQPQQAAPPRAAQQLSPQAPSMSPPSDPEMFPSEADLGMPSQVAAVQPQSPEQKAQEARFSELEANRWTPGDPLGSRMPFATDAFGVGDAADMLGALTMDMALESSAEGALEADAAPPADASRSSLKGDPQDGLRASPRAASPPRLLARPSPQHAGRSPTPPPPFGAQRSALTPPPPEFPARAISLPPSFQSPFAAATEQGGSDVQPAAPLSPTRSGGGGFLGAGLGNGAGLGGGMWGSGPLGGITPQFSGYAALGSAPQYAQVP